MPILDRLTPELCVSYLTVAPCGIAVLPLVSDVLQARLLTPALLGRIAAILGVAFDAIVVDLPAGVTDLTRTILDRCDHVVVLAEPTGQGLQRARYAVDYLRTQQVPIEAMALCINRAPERGALPTDRLERTLGIRVSASIPDAPDTVTASLVTGAPILGADPRHPVSRALDRLGREVTTMSHRAAGAEATSAQVNDDDEAYHELKLTIHRRLIRES